MLTFFPIASAARDAEEALGSRAEGFHDAALVDDDDGVRRGFQNGAQPRFALLKRGVARRHAGFVWRGFHERLSSRSGYSAAVRKGKHELSEQRAGG